MAAAWWFATIAAWLTTAPAAAESVAKVESYGVRLAFPSAGVKKTFGTVWCMSPDCDVLVTNHHVAAQFQHRTRVRGVPIAKQVSATDTNSSDAEWISTGAGRVKQVNVRDLALLWMKRPVPGLTTVSVYNGRLHPGEMATFEGYPHGRRVTLQGQFEGEQADGTLLFSFSKPLSFGASGGLLTNSDGQAIGTVLAVARKDPRRVVAVPMWALAEFVREVHPELGTLFPAPGYHPSPDALEISPEPVELEESYTMLIEAAGTDPQPAISDSRVSEPDRAIFEDVENSRSATVRALRAKAKSQSDVLRNFVALEQLTFDGGAVWEHEIQVVDGDLHFRTPKGAELTELPYSKHGVVPGDLWHTFAALLADERVSITEISAPTSVDKHLLRFAYNASAESGVCSARVRVQKSEWEGSARCFGEVWTSEDLAFLRFTQELSLPAESLADSLRSVVVFGKVEGRDVPASMEMEFLSRDGERLRSHINFRRYRLFQASSVIRYESSASDVKTRRAFRPHADNNASRNNLSPPLPEQSSLAKQ